MQKRPGVIRRIAAQVANRLGAFAAGAKRTVFKGAELSRLWWDWVASPISADQETYNDFLRLRSRARELRRNNPLIRMYVDMLSTNVIGPAGMRLRCRVRNASGALNKQINQKIEAAWTDWSVCVTVDGRSSLTDWQHGAVESLAVDGETIVRKIRSFKGNKYRYALQAIDPDLLDHTYFRTSGSGDNQNEIRLGVEVDEWATPVAYWFWDRHPTDMYAGSPRKHIRVPAEEVLHIYRPDRVNQSRGVTWLNSIMMPTKMLDGYVEAEVVAARIGAAKMGFFQFKDGSDYEPPKEGERLSIEAQPGQFEQLPPGMEFKEWNPAHPGTAFPNFIKAMQRWIASGLRISYNTLANDLEGVNYSSLRSALLTERDQWRKLQVWWAQKVLHNIYGEWLEFAQLSSQVMLDSRDWSAFLEVKFMPRGWAWVDPLKDVNATVAAVDNGLASRARELAEQGEDFGEIAEELKEEQDLIEALGLQLTGVGVGAGAAAGDQPNATPAQADAGAGGSGRAAARRAKLLELVHEGGALADFAEELLEARALVDELLRKIRAGDRSIAVAARRDARLRLVSNEED